MLQKEIVEMVYLLEQVWHGKWTTASVENGLFGVEMGLFFGERLAKGLRKCGKWTMQVWEMDYASVENCLFFEESVAGIVNFPHLHGPSIWNSTKMK